VIKEKKNTDTNNIPSFFCERYDFESCFFLQRCFSAVLRRCTDAFFSVFLPFLFLCFALMLLMLVLTSASAHVCICVCV
jgi:hypothetical protein